MVSQLSASRPDLLYYTTYMPGMYLCVSSAAAVAVAAADAADALCVALPLFLLQLQLLFIIVRRMAKNCCPLI